MEAELQDLRKAALYDIQNATAPLELDQLRVKFLGRSGALTKLSEGMRNIPKEQRPTLGKLLNEVRQAIAAKSPEARREAALKGAAKRTHEQRSEAARKGAATKGPEARRQAGVKSAATRGKEAMREAALKGVAERDPEAHREAVRRGLAARSPETRKESARKAAETRKRNREAAKGEAPVSPSGWRSFSCSVRSRSAGWGSA